MTLNPTSDPTWINMDVDPRERRMRGSTIHGGFYFDVPYISQITDNLWVGGCTDGLYLPFEITNILSLYPWEKYENHDEVANALYVRMYDSTTQGMDQVHELAEWVNRRRKEGQTLVHCQAGLNRSNLIAATALILEGMDPQEAINLLREKRSPAVLCNVHFEEWLLTQGK